MAQLSCCCAESVQRVAYAAVMTTDVHAGRLSRYFIDVGLYIGAVISDEVRVGLSCATPTYVTSTLRQNI